MSNAELFHQLLILRSPGIGSARFNDLMAIYGSAEAVVQSVTFSDSFVDAVKREMDLTEQIGGRYVDDASVFYPGPLKEIKNHPPILCVRGNIDALKKKTVGIVGTRHATAAGMRFVSELASEFAAHGFAVVSGMAMGTDTAAHRGALDASGDANTIAVLAGGVDYIWPLENERLYHYIIERGAVISEMPAGTKASVTHFAQRNRWIAGLSESLILGEADLKSGSMATAGFSYRMGRKIYAIPSHPSDSRSYGPNKLIRSGIATLVTGKNDFFDVASSKIKKENEKGGDDDLLLNLLGPNSVSDSVLANLAGKNIAEIKSALVVLELKGLIKKVDGGYVRI
jgi:DNA processing protein